jgi:hypothetical protein
MWSVLLVRMLLSAAWLVPDFVAILARLANLQPVRQRCARLQNP